MHIADRYEELFDIGGMKIYYDKSHTFEFLFSFKGLVHMKISFTVMRGQVYEPLTSSPLGQ